MGTCSNPMDGPAGAAAEAEDRCKCGRWGAVERGTFTGDAKKGRGGWRRKLDRTFLAGLPHQRFSQPVKPSRRRPLFPAGGRKEADGIDSHGGSRVSVVIRLTGRPHPCSRPPTSLPPCVFGMDALGVEWSK